MARVVVYGSSVPCPDMARFGWWLDRHEVDAMVIRDVHRDREAMEILLGLTGGNASVPTLVITDDDEWLPLRPPSPLAGRLRGVDRGTVLTEPNPGQIAGFLRANGIEVREREKWKPAGGRGGAAGGDADAEGPTVVTVYPITGRQLFFRVPESWCRECDLTIRAVEHAIEGRQDVVLRIKPWWNHLFDALRRGGWHAPVVTINGKVFSQGVVPELQQLRQALDVAGGQP
ncbi:MAG: glutaredoxin family protein [Dehalococcoidia bacterium]